MNGLCSLLPLLVMSFTWLPMETKAGNILCLVGTARHNNPGWMQPLFEALAERGHSLTVLSTAPVPTKNIEGITVFSLPNNYDVMQKYFVSRTASYSSVFTAKQLMVLHEVPLGSCRAVMESPVLAKLRAQLIDEVADVDLIISDATNTMECLLPLVPKHRSIPILGVSGGKLTSELLTLVRAEDTINVAKIPHPISQLPENMDFMGRMQNSALYLAEKLIRWTDIYPITRGALVRKNHVYPPLKLVLLNTHSTLDYAQNLPASVIEVGGLHIWTKSRPLPPNIQKFVDKFIDGIIYINFPHIDLFFGIGTKAVLLMAQRYVTYGFIWNVENVKELPEKMDNILTLHVDARLQQDILAQSGVKCFLNHGDSFSLQEAVHYAVPVLVIPLILEQFNNAQRIEERNLGVVLPTNTFFEMTMARTLTQVLQNKAITNAVSKAQVKFRTRPMPPVRTAVWYVEHLITEPELYSHLAKPSVNFIVSHSLDTLAIPAVALLVFLCNLILLVLQLMKSDGIQSRIFVDDDGNMGVCETLEEYGIRTGIEKRKQIPPPKKNNMGRHPCKNLPDKAKMSID
ncbi:2-hydroxyacylsphingosine 1-beta-galactosyltransferase isoform X1 [Drosophila miranda]|uniref:2-hydroxyacylsphingosine 1-beta-galactosyltransferase isoform X1 n=1 Tax=Drosophila miranda TaxID=7229 RepID=UPI0007E5E885|nr:2-hydroxyacylsphingosine 1-beta-galactosyltransferase isoform X1 [Drosophila miranda]